MNELIVPDRTSSNAVKNLDPEKERISRYERRWKNRPPKIRTTSLAEEGDNPLELLARYADSVGSVSEDFRSLVLAQLKSVMPHLDVDEEVFINAGLAFLHGLNPEDELEGALAVQLFALHVVGLEMMKRALVAKDAFGNDIQKLVDSNVNQADRILRAFREALAALLKYRGKTTQQRVTVEHVHVGDGGQAIVGAVNQERGE